MNDEFYVFNKIYVNICNITIIYTYIYIYIYIYIINITILHYIIFQCVIKIVIYVLD